MKEYFLSFLAVLFVGCFAELLSANNKYRSYISLCTGIVITLAMIAPLTTIVETFFANETIAYGENTEPLWAQKQTSEQRGFDADAFILRDTQSRIQKDIETSLLEKSGIDAQCEVKLLNQNGSVHIDSVTVYLEGGAEEEAIKNLIFEFYSVEKNNIHVIER